MLFATVADFYQMADFRQEYTFFHDGFITPYYGVITPHYGVLTHRFKAILYNYNMVLSGSIGDISSLRYSKLTN